MGLNVNHSTRDDNEECMTNSHRKGVAEQKQGTKALSLFVSVTELCAGSGAHTSERRDSNHENKMKTIFSQ